MDNALAELLEAQEELKALGSKLQSVGVGPGDPVLVGHLTEMTSVLGRVLTAEIHFAREMILAEVRRSRAP